MVDFLTIGLKYPKKGYVDVYPKFIVKGTSTDLMVRGGDFYAVWLEDQKMWSTNEQDVIDLVDRELKKNYEEKKLADNFIVNVHYMWDADSGSIDRWHKYCQRQMRDNYKPLNEKLVFENSETTKKDYASKKLPYPLEECETPAYERLMSVLYSPEERHKIEWAIGSVVNGASKKLQKFVVLYGPPGSGKGTVLQIIDKLFEGYTTTFSAKNLGMTAAQFALEPFKDNPLVAMQMDGDLSRIEDNSRLNMLVSHEKMTINEKHKSQYEAKFNTFCFLGTNNPVKITDAKSGMLRRLIDVNPSGEKVPKREYDKLMDQIEFELPGIAWRCKKIFEEDPRYYDGYIPEKMVSDTNDFYNFIVSNLFELEDADMITLKQAWEMYKTWCDDAKIQYPLNMRQFKNEMSNYFDEFRERGVINDQRVRSVFVGFKKDIFKSKEVKKEDEKAHMVSWLEFNCTESLFDKEFAECKAQECDEEGNPKYKWINVKTKLKDIDSSKLHYIQIPQQYVTYDFDIPDEDGNKSLEKNMEAASKFPPTYAELSKSGCGIHLTYIYNGDIEEVNPIHSDHVEVKLMKGNAALRRKLTLCNDLPIAEIKSGVKKKERKNMYNIEAFKTEKKLREFIETCLEKKHHGHTAPEVNFIFDKLEDAYASGMKYDITDMRQRILVFAMSSHNQADKCVKLVNKMKFHSEEYSETEAPMEDLVFYDVEVFPNLFLVNWKVENRDKVYRLINPTSVDIEKLLQYKLVGFNCRRYDNHIMYARLMGYTNEQLYNLSQKIISGTSKNCFFGEAYNLSYTDVYDFCSKKQSLKKWEIELGIHHQELGLPWDQPVPEELWEKVAEYCDNDVIATEAVFHARHDDFVARQILADLAGMTVNDTSNSLTTRIIFGTERRPQSQFNYRDMGDTSDFSEKKTMAMIKECGLEGQVDLDYTAFDSKGRPLFPGYIYQAGKSLYRGVEVGEGGRVYAEHGIWTLVALLDIASQHPSSAIDEWLFGDFTQNYKNLLDARLFIKHGDFDSVKKMFGGKLAKYMEDPSMADTLSQALKIPINSVYGLTAASFDNPFRDPRNIDNIVAKRGALFMVNLENEIKRHGWKVCHIKTDSIKIPNATREMIDFVNKYGKLYGYTFEHEATYDRMCLSTNADYICKYATVEQLYELYGKAYVDMEKDICKKNKKKGGTWDVTGSNFAHPFIFKTLFTHERIVFEDLCETKAVKEGEIYLDMNEDLPQLSYEESKELSKIDKAWHSPAGSQPLEELAKKLGYTYEQIGARYSELCKKEEESHNYIFVGRVGLFCPMEEGAGGGYLYRCKDGKYYAVAGTKDQRWMESEMVKALGDEYMIDMDYYRKMANEAVETIKQFGDFDSFANGKSYVSPDFMNVPEGYPDEVVFPPPWDPDPAELEHPKDG